MKKYLFSSLLMLILPAGIAVSCGVNPKPSKSLVVKQNEIQTIVDKYQIKQTFVDHNNDGIINFQFKGRVQDKSEFNNLPSGFDDSKISVLPKEVYNAVIDIFKQARGEKNGANQANFSTIANTFGLSQDDLKTLIGTDAIAEVIITDNEFHVEIVKYKNSKAHEIDYLENSDSFQIEEVNTSPYGVWMARVKFFEKGDDAQWEHGTSHKSNYQITGYPLYFVNTQFASLGVSNQNVDPNQIYQISYDHNS